MTPAQDVPKVDLGKMYADRPTGFVGQATARCEYLAGDVQILLEAIAKDGRLVQEWFSESRLERH